MNDDAWHKFILQAFDELGDNFEYEKFRKRLIELKNVERMKRFLRLEERWSNKGGVNHDDVE